MNYEIIQSLNSLVSTKLEPFGVQAFFVSNPINPEQLLPADLTDYQSRFQNHLSPNEKRKTEWLTGRRALYELAEKVNAQRNIQKQLSREQNIRCLPPVGPRSFPSLEWSLSHSGEIACAIYKPGARGVGVDIETRTPPEKSGRFYLNEKDRELFHGIPQYPQVLQKIWTLKEAVFKADMQNEGKGIREYTFDSWPGGVDAFMGTQTGSFNEGHYSWWSEEFNLDSMVLQVSVAWKKLFE